MCYCLIAWWRGRLWRKLKHLKIATIFVVAIWGVSNIDNIIYKI
ncbi:hypothetical protein [Moraxella lacunata]